MLISSLISANNTDENKLVGEFLVVSISVVTFCFKQGKKWKNIICAKLILKL